MATETHNDHEGENDGGVVGRAAEGSAAAVTLTPEQCAERLDAYAEGMNDLDGGAAWGLRTAAEFVRRHCVRQP